MRRRTDRDVACPAQDLHPARLLGICGTKILGRRIVLFDSVESTNAAAMAAVVAGAAEGTLFIAERQTLGKGRKGRSWFSAEGKSLTFSLILRPPRKEEALTAILALAVVRALWNFVGRSTVKWPNDVFLNGRKLAGILAESREGAVVVGLGLNVNETPADFPSAIAGEATSMRIAAKKTFDRARVLCRILEMFEALYEEFQRGGFAPLRKDVEDRLLYIGERVSIESGGNVFKGNMIGITDEGYLRLEAGGTERVFSSGDLTLVGKTRRR
ncbi:MAG: biotin--[acetyl-CoA-carboxylase] ligase [Candidatus Krumholzibacteria bacterium]|nr:biotin--[acetyl-CoA-carboxylase] ligase [Candidatus Krumholzibacteria bacterium]